MFRKSSLLFLALLVPLTALAQAGGAAPAPGPATASGPRIRAFLAVRKAWSIPAEEASVQESSPSMTPAMLATAAYLSRGAKAPLDRVTALRASGLTWRAVALAVGARLPSEVGAAPPEGGVPGADDAAIEIAAEVKTLERLTGRSAEAFRRRLDAGENFEAMASEAADLMGGVAGRGAGSEGASSTAPQGPEGGPGPLQGAPPSALPGSQGQISTQGEGRGFQTPRR